MWTHTGHPKAVSPGSSIGAFGMPMGVALNWALSTMVLTTGLASSKLLLEPFLIIGAYNSRGIGFCPVTMPRTLRRLGRQSKFVSGSHASSVSLTGGLRRLPFLSVEFALKASRWAVVKDCSEGPVSVA